MRIEKINEVKNQMEVFLVNVLPKIAGSVSVGKCDVYIQKYEICADPEIDNLTNSYFVQGIVKQTYDYDKNTKCWFTKYRNRVPSVYKFSLSDAGVEQNPKYNDHRLYDNLVQAKTYGEAMYEQYTSNQTNKKEDPIKAYERAMGILG